MIGNAEKFRLDINKKFQEFIDTPIVKFNHIDSVVDYHVLIQLFLYKAKMTTLLIQTNVETDPGLNVFLFPIGKVIKSNSQKFSEGSVISINPTLIMLMEHPKWTVYKESLNTAPAPPPPIGITQYVWGIDVFDTGWPQRRYFDPFVNDMDERLYIANENDIKLKYDLTKIDSQLINLNKYIDGKF